MKLAKHVEKYGKPPAKTAFERFGEKFLCFGHTPVDLAYLDSQSKMRESKPPTAEKKLKEGDEQAESADDDRTPTADDDGRRASGSTRRILDSDA